MCLNLWQTLARTPGWKVRRSALPFHRAKPQATRRKPLGIKYSYDFVDFSSGSTGYFYLRINRLSATPSRTPGAVFEHDALGKELLADAVGLGEVAAFPRLLPASNHRFDGSRVQAALEELF